MKLVKTLLVSFSALALLLGLTACGKNENVSGTLEEIMEKVYADIPENERPMMLMNTELTDENAEYYLGTADIKYEEAMASESGVGSIAHSVVLVRVSNDADVEEVKSKIKENVDPRKWICVEAETVKVESKGNLIILIMSSNDNAEKIEKSFKNL